MKIKKVLISALLLGVLASNTRIVQADTTAKAKDEGWDIPSVALGNGLT